MRVLERAGHLSRHPVRNRRHTVSRHRCGYCRETVTVRCMGGIGSRRAMLTSKPPGPPISLRTTATGGAATTTSTATAFTACLAGSLQICVVGYSRGATGSPTLGLSGSGWVLLGSFQGNVATLNSGAAVWARATAGGETTFNVTASNAVTITWTVEEWLNVDTTTLPVGPTAPFTFSTTTSTSAQNVNSNNRVTTDAGELVWSFIAGRGPATGTMSQAFGGGATGNMLTASGRVAVAFTAYQLVPAAATSVTHTMQYTNTQGSANTVYGSISFKQVP